MGTTTTTTDPTTTTTTTTQTSKTTTTTTESEGTKTASPVSECGDGWQHGSYVEVWSGNCYWLMSQALPEGHFEYREECSQTCNDVVGHLCSIHSEEEERFVIDLIHKHGTHKTWL